MPKTKHRGRIYWPNCKVCTYMRRNPEFRSQVMASAYFEPQAEESLAEVCSRWGNPLPMQSVYTHMRRHQSKPTREIEATAPETAVSLPVIEGELETPDASTAHERALDEIIVKGREAVRSGNLKVTGQMLNTAIKTKADIIKSDKDRGLDALKLMQGAFGGIDGGDSPQISDSEG